MAGRGNHLRGLPPGRLYGPDAVADLLDGAPAGAGLPAVFAILRQPAGGVHGRRVCVVLCHSGFVDPAAVDRTCLSRDGTAVAGPSTPQSEMPLRAAAALRRMGELPW